MNLEQEFIRLNEYQRAAVVDESDACLLNAKVGSGKTTVLISKILYLHYHEQIPYEDMIVLTFTNKAADEIKERLAVQDESVREEQMKGFGTFHSVALYLLREKLPIETLGYEPGFTVITPEEEVELGLLLMDENSLSIKYKNRLKKRLEQERPAYEQGKKEPRYKDDLFRLMRLLGQEKLRQNKFTFRDLLRVTNYLLKKGCANFSPRWIIVDEVQDSDGIQMEFMENLKGCGVKFFAVGDPNQVIYSWRGSSSSIFYQLKAQFGAKEMTLPINYRSSGAILAAASCFLQNPDELSGSRGRGERIVIKNHYNAFVEAQYLTEEIKQIHKKGIPYREIAVFYRLQSQSEQLEKAFAKEGIAFEVSMKKTVQDVPVLSWFLCVMRAACNEKDVLAERKALGDKTYGEKQEGLAGKIKRFSVEFSAENLENKIVDGEAVYDYFDLDRNLRPTSAKYEQERQLVLDMIERMIAFALEKKLGMVEGFREFLNSSALYGIQILKKEVDMKADSVKLMTLHASKGLEFTHVFIIGVNYGLIPLQTKDFEEEDEERRLFFVGMTRAKDYLELSYYTSPEQVRVMPGESRYLRMIPEELVQSEKKVHEKVDLQKMRKEVEKSSMVQPLAMLFGVADEQGKSSLSERNSMGNGEPEERKVRHSKYGVGIITSEDETMVEAEFENYGKKQFVKAFSELEYL
ncbi:MAG: ATP-dependent helicase [Hespellia sp.]|nr:ATP-dependent helicase [Hespellia sp.]